MSTGLFFVPKHGFLGILNCKEIRIWIVFPVLSLAVFVSLQFLSWGGYYRKLSANETSDESVFPVLSAGAHKKKHSKNCAFLFLF